MVIILSGGLVKLFLIENNKMTSSQNLEKGAHNLLKNCANLLTDQKLIIISEDPSLGWYSSDITHYIKKAATEMGIKTSILEVGEPQNDSKSKLTDIIEDFDCVLFFARIGDQDRFEKSHFKTKRVMSYVRNLENLGSTFGHTHHHSLIELKKAINSIFSKGGLVKITCPLGTSVEGNLPQTIIDESSDVGVLRFPMLVPTPVSAKKFSGKVVLTKYLTPSGSKVYEPASLALKSNIFTIIKDGKIEGFEGDNETIKNVEKHYHKISKMFNISKNIVDSWHAGIHPGTYYNKSIEENPDRWSNTIFGSPKYLHFHTCGDYPPGEICWMIENPSITIQNIPLWENGNLMLKNFQETSSLLEKWVDLKKLFVN